MSTVRHIKACGALAMQEALGAESRYGQYASDHEAYAVLLEEVDEAWEHVRAKETLRNTAGLRVEALQIAAVAIKWAALLSERIDADGTEDDGLDYQDKQYPTGAIEMAERFCFLSDDDGHNYLVPARLRNKFFKDMEQAYGSDDFSGVDWIDQYRADAVSGYSFEDPKQE